MLPKQRLRTEETIKAVPYGINQLTCFSEQEIQHNADGEIVFQASVLVFMWPGSVSRVCYSGLFRRSFHLSITPLLFTARWMQSALIAECSRLRDADKGRPLPRTVIAWLPSPSQCPRSPPRHIKCSSLCLAVINCPGLDQSCGEY